MNRLLGRAILCIWGIYLRAITLGENRSTTPNVRSIGENAESWILVKKLNENDITFLFIIY